MSTSPTPPPSADTKPADPIREDEARERVHVAAPTAKAIEAKERIAKALYEVYWDGPWKAESGATRDAWLQVTDAALKAFGFRDWTQAAALMSGEAEVRERPKPTDKWGRTENVPQTDRGGSGM